MKTTMTRLILTATLITFGIQAEAFNSSKSEVSANLNPLKVSETIITPSANEKEIKSGQTVEVKLKLNLDPGFHAYLDQYKLELIKPQGFYLSEFQIQPTVKFQDPITKKIKVGTESYAEMVSLLEIPATASGGVHHLELQLTYQACGKDFCLFPKTITIKKDLRVSGGSSDLLQNALDKGWLYALILVFFAGVLTSFTPCIFPMIPITLAILGTKDHGRTRLQGFFISLCYVLGIALTYAVLGVVAAKTGALFGSLLGHPIAIAIVAGLFVFMGLSMYGLFEIQVPSFIANKLVGSKTQKGMVGAFLSGLIAGIVASPCVGPVLIGILAYVAQTQDVVTGFILLFTFAIGLGQIFLVIGTFNTLLHRLPKSGPWMEQIKFIFGSVMIGMALYFVYPVSSGPIFDGLVSTTLIAVAIYFGAFRKHTEHEQKNKKLVKTIFQFIFLFGLLFAVKALTPKHMQAKVLTGVGIASDEKKVPGPIWYKYSDELLEKAIQDKKPVIIDFKADWCLACKELELYTFSDQRVIELGTNFIWLEFDATSPSDALSELQKRYDIGGLPFVVIYNSKGEHVRRLTLTGFENADQFLNRMKEALK
jgi:thioredoxin:protein disulfide reductase